MKNKIRIILKDAGDMQANLQCNVTLDLLTAKIVNAVRENQNPSLKKAVDQLNKKHIHPYRYESGE